MNDLTDIVIETRSDPVRDSFYMLDDMYVEKGTKADWEDLKQLHYKNHGTPMGAHYYRCMYEEQLVGVCIFSLPKLILGQRHDVFPKLRPNTHIDNTTTNRWRAKFVNANFTVNSRIVVDTLFRGSGVAYRFQNIASRMTGKQYIEIQSSMSKFNPFAMKAGYRFSKPKSAQNYEKGLKFMKSIFTSHPGDQVAILEELHSFPEFRRIAVEQEIRDFYYKHSALEQTGKQLRAGQGRVNAMPIQEVISNLHQLVFASPMYGVYVNPDVNRELPERIYLNQFDRQRTDEPLCI